ncbi:hypothetical protein [Sphingomonas sp. PAMC 26617]|uniref:hypothetical protein n=1 Tax=Sphingomonas sp. PAMC 26617 TaxID=1112216 RepID=UPI000288DC9D|nr:hypothetical protein [Sphingomonas sp. PAMC 26617]
MERPVSIIWFERCYLGATAVGLVNTALSWNSSLQRMAENPGAAQFGPAFGGNILLFGTAIAIVLTLTLWYFTARRRSVVTKWIITAFFGLGVLGIVTSLRTGTTQPGIGGVLMIVAFVLNALAVWQLFRPDAALWFDEVVA